MRSSIEISASNSLLISSTGVDIFASGDLDDYFQFSVTSDRPLFTAIGNYLVLGKDAATGHSLDDDDVLFGEDIEVDGIAYLDGGATFADTKSIDAGSTTDDYLVGKAFDTGGSMTEIWRMVGAAEPYFATGSSQSNKFYHDGTVTLGGVVTMGANLEVGTIDIDDDSGAVVLVDEGITADPAAGTEESYAFAIDGTTHFKIYAEADSAGSIQNSRLEAAYNLRFTNNEDSTAVVDTMSIGAYEFSAGNRGLAVSAEAVVTASGDIASTHTFPLRYNGVTYNVLCSNA